MLSAVETIKTQSHFLRGSIVESLQNPLTGALHDDDTQLIKFHGSYQQDDRDQREERRAAKLEPAWSFMIRTRTPGGACTPAQWLALDDIARTYANGTLRLTTRQAFQFHGVIKRELKPTIAAINAALMDTIAACGDVNRNVMASANPLASAHAAHAEVQAWAVKLSEHLLPQTRAYHEIWLDGERISGEEAEPIYGATYLPRKFKAAVALPPLNDVDVFAQDLAFVAIVENHALLGFNVLVGGGMGTTHGDPSTYPRLASVIGFIAPSQLLAVAEAVVTTQRDWGDRSNRRLARLKYTLDRVGIERFVAEVEQRAKVQLAPARPFHFEHNGDRFGWIQQGVDQWQLTLRIPAGRIADVGDARLLSALREIAQTHTGSFVLTPNQNLAITGVATTARAAIDAVLRQHQVDTGVDASAIRQRALACVALPTCPLAMAEAERYLPALVGKIEVLMQQHQLLAQPISLRITGCPNGCARPYLAEIALIGKASGRYNLHLGGDLKGERLNQLYRENIDEAQILTQLDTLFARYAEGRQVNEPFGDFLLRTELGAANGSASVAVGAHF
jgi:sulfite reductase (NADPH) hemoprotein beta-component